MVLGAIDIGSNSVRLLVAEAGERGEMNPLHYGLETTRLARDIGTTGRLSEAAMLKTLEALKGYVKTLAHAGAAHITAIGTSALREASNAEDFMARARAEAGISVEVVSGLREAELTTLGVAASLRFSGSALITDVGGGSTEFIAVRDGHAVASVTLPLGVVKLLDRHVLSDPPTSGELALIDNDARACACEARDAVGDALGESAALIATAGTATTLAAIDLELGGYDRAKVHGHSITIERLHAMSASLSALSLAGRAGVAGVYPGREDLIIPGIRLTITIMEAFGFSSMIVSDQGLLEGALRALMLEVLH